MKVFGRMLMVLLTVLSAVVFTIGVMIIMDTIARTAGGTYAVSALILDFVIGISAVCFVIIVRGV